MSAPAPPVLTVRYDGSESTFAAGHDVVVGRDLRADMRITHPLISRAHLLLRFDQGRWLAIDNGSLNGTFVNGRRVPVVEIHDGQCVNIGNPDGPQLTFEVGRHLGMAGRPPQTESMGIPVAAHPAGRAWSAAPGRPVAAPPGPPPGPAGRPPNWASPPRRPHPGAPGQRPGPPGQPMYAGGGRAPAPPPAAPPPPNFQPHPQMAGVASPQTEMSRGAAKPPEVANLATKMFQALMPSRSGALHKPSGALTIGRATDNDIVIQDVLASRHHAFLTQTPLGTEIRDAHSVNGTFVNGVRVGSAVLTEGDVVTIGNVDLVFTRGELLRRTEAATRTGGLEVNSVCYTVDHGKQLLDHISLTARPGTLTAIIGGSGAGKTTLSRLIVGYTSPTSGSVTFEGHDIHSEYASMRSRIGMVPQDDVVHRQLTVNQALNYAAELRLPPDTSKAERAQIVAQVLEELDMTKHAETRVDKLSGGQRKRASVALELLTQPSLLLLDEPTSGLDPALDRQVMLMLRQLADAGRVVLVVTHSVSYLEVCDQILLVAPGGKTAFCGPPDQVEAAMGTRNWADIFAKVGADPDEANRRFKERSQRSSQPPSAAEPGRPGRTTENRPMAAAVHDRPPPGSPRRIRPRLHDLPGGLAVPHRRVVADGERPAPRPRPGRPARCRAHAAAVHHGAVEHRCRLHGHRADHPRPDRRARHLPARAGRRPVHHGLSAGQDRGVLRLRDRPGGGGNDDRAAGQGCADGTPPVLRQLHLLAVRHRRGHLCGFGDARPAVVGPARSPTNRSCRCWWCRSCRSWCSPVG